MPLPSEALLAVASWLELADKFQKAGYKGEKPDNDLLRIALAGKTIDGRTLLKPELIEDGAAVRIWLKKPKPFRGQESRRDLDPEGAALLALLRLPGASIYLEGKGPGRDKFYGRLEVFGDADRRVVIVRIIAETPVGLQTDEPDNHHSWRRLDLRHRQAVPGDTLGLYGIEDAKRWAKERLQEVMQASPHKIPAPLTEERYSDLLDVAHRLMRNLPLDED